MQHQHNNDKIQQQQQQQLQKEGPNHITEQHTQKVDGFLPHDLGQ